MWLSKDNRDAVVSSALVGTAVGLFFFALVKFGVVTTVDPWKVGVVFAVVGFVVGLLVTWDLEDDTDSNADV